MAEVEADQRRDFVVLVLAVTSQLETC